MITEEDLYTRLRAFLLAVVLAGTGVYKGQVNRVAEPQEVDFVMMTVLSRVRLRTNVDTYDVEARSKMLEQATQITFQLDIHGPNSTDNAQLISTYFRDQYGCEAFGKDVQPLYCGDGTQAPFINGEKQYEDRWVMPAVLQANILTSTPQDFADTLTPTFVS